jgi:hypothetical protein
VVHSRGVFIPRTASARDVTNAWWAAVEREHITDPSILCLSRDPEVFDIQDENGDQVEIDDDVEIFLQPLNRTSPEVMRVDVTWDGHDGTGQSSRLTIPVQVHLDAPRSRLLALWIEHHKAIPSYAEVASHLFTDENEHNWTDQTGAKTAPPWTPGQQVIFKLKPWTRENMADRQQKRPRPSPSDGKGPLGPFSHFSPAPPSTLTGGAGTADTGTASPPADGAADQIGNTTHSQGHAPRSR